MIRIRALLSVFALSLFLSGHSVAAADKSRDEIDHFNQNLIQLHLNMDHAGILALWADDGVDLMPDSAPIIGKPAITAWLNNVLANLKGYKVTKQEMEFHDIRISGDWLPNGPLSTRSSSRQTGSLRLRAMERSPSCSTVWVVNGRSPRMWNSAPRPDSHTTP